MSRGSLEVRALEPADWPALERLFGERGACGGCWCMVWRLPTKEWEAGKGGANREAFRQLVESGAVRGTMAFHGGEAVGWCSAAPRADFGSLARKPSLRTDWDERTWSVTCFFLRREWRGRGIGQRLLEEAVRLARGQGARRIEGYPVVPSGAAGRMPAPFVWTGLPSMFERAGFRAIPDPPGRRPIYVRNLRGRKA